MLFSFFLFFLSFPHQIWANSNQGGRWLRPQSQYLLMFPSRAVLFQWLWFSLQQYCTPWKQSQAIRDSAFKNNQAKTSSCLHFLKKSVGKPVYVLQHGLCLWNGQKMLLYKFIAAFCIELSFQMDVRWWGREFHVKNIESFKRFYVASCSFFWFS